MKLYLDQLAAAAALAGTVVLTAAQDGCTTHKYVLESPSLTVQDTSSLGSCSQEGKAIIGTSAESPMYVCKNGAWVMPSTASSAGDDTTQQMAGALHCAPDTNTGFGVSTGGSYKYHDKCITTFTVPVDAVVTLAYNAHCAAKYQMYTYLEVDSDGIDSWSPYYGHNGESQHRHDFLPFLTENNGGQPIIEPCGTVRTVEVAAGTHTFNVHYGHTDNAGDYRHYGPSIFGMWVAKNVPEEDGKKGPWLSSRHACASGAQDDTMKSTPGCEVLPTKLTPQAAWGNDVPGQVLDVFSPGVITVPAPATLFAAHTSHIRLDTSTAMGYTGISLNKDMVNAFGQNGQTAGFSDQFGGSLLNYGAQQGLTSSSGAWQGILASRTAAVSAGSIEYGLGYGINNEGAWNQKKGSLNGGASTATAIRRALPAGYRGQWDDVVLSGDFHCGVRPRATWDSVLSPTFALEGKLLCTATIDLPADGVVFVGAHFHGKAGTGQNCYPRLAFDDDLVAVPGSSPKMDGDFKKGTTFFSKSSASGWQPVFMHRSGELAAGQHTIGLYLMSETTTGTCTAGGFQLQGLWVRKSV